MIGPSLTYFFGSSNIKPYIFGEYMFGSSKLEYSEKNSTTGSKVNMNGWALGAGIAFFMNQHISLNPVLGYAKTSGEQEYIDQDIDIEMTAKGFALNGGISDYF
jgi:hypothetical protein